MDYRYCEPPVPTLARWRKLYSDHRGASVVRALEYERLAQETLTGRVLDVGGGKKAKYVRQLPSDLEIESVNIDPDIGPTHLIEPGAPFPVPDASFDHVICLNTLEHIYDPLPVMAEMHRVLKPGGRAIITVPWIFRIHGHPDDFLRATPSWWRASAERAGFGRLQLTPLVWGRSTSAGSISGHGAMGRRLRFHLSHLMDWLYASIAFRGPTMSGSRAERICAVSVGWYIVATRGSEAQAKT